MIKVVVLQLSQEMRTALWRAHKIDAACDAAGDAVISRGERKGELEVTADMAADWCGHWFTPEQLEAAIIYGPEQMRKLAEYDREPLVSDFRETILKIYRLTVSV